MEFNSPQPEHAQLHGHIYPKDTESLFGMLQQRVSIREEQGSASRENSIENSGTQSMNTAGYENKRDVNEESSVSVLTREVGDGQDDGNLIPSPPLSPKLSQERLVRRGNDEDSNIKQLLAECKQEIVVTASWVPGMTSKRYRYATHGFLSQYRLLGYGNGGYSRPKKHATPGAMVANRKAVTRLGQNNNGGGKSYASGSDFEKVYRTRRMAKTSGPSIGADAEEISATELPSRPAPRPNRKSKKARPYQPHQHSSSQLASTKDVHSAPTYVPNMSWEKLPDYSPPLSTLPSNNNNKCLKVEWKGSSMDLSQDPLRHKLHPAELVLAQTLRLPCDLYLDSKRRLFCEKVHRLKQGMPFRRTDAQKACRIDVNKASRLFAAYEKIGWLDDDNFAKYL